MKKVIRILEVLFLVVLASIGSVMWLVMTPTGTAMLTPWLNARLSSATGMEAKIEGLRWVHPLGLRVESLRFQHEGEPALEVKNFSTRLSSRRLLVRELHVYYLRADAVNVSYGPAGDQAPDPDTVFSFDAPPELPDLKALFEQVEIKELALPEIRLLPPFLEQETRLSLNGKLVNGTLDLELDAESETLPRSTLRLRAQRSESFEQEQSLLVELKADGSEVMVESKLEVLSKRAGLQLQFQRLEAEALARRVSLEEPLILNWTGEGLALSKSPIRIGDGRFRIEGALSDESVQLNAGIDSVPLDAFGLAGVTDPGASVGGSLEATGTPSDPEITLSMDLGGLKPENPELWEGPPARLNLKAAVAGGRGTLNLRIADLPGDPVVLDLEVPLRLSLRPFQVDFPEDEPLRGSLTSSTDLAGLSRLFVLDVYHQLSGTLDVDFRLEGTFADPRLQGAARVLDGAYEHDLAGLHLRDLNFALTADRNVLRLEHLEAGDGRSGNLVMDAEVELAAGRKLEFNGELTLRDFQAVRQDQLDAVVNGTLRWAGDRESSQLQGRLALRPVEIRIPERMPHTVRTVNVVERFEDGRADVEEEEPELRPPRHDLTLDLRLESADRIFVRGRGLDSEWSASLVLRGPVYEPVLTGELSVIRGRFLFFGKRLVVTRGEVFFDGAFPPDPVLDVAAEIRSGGVLGILRVGGPVSGPEFELDSNPPLPEDEILARVLFGRESSGITPFQALTLANAINTLRGGGGAFDVMGTTRRVLRVDQIEIRTDDEEQGETRVAVGRYLGDRIYVELERGMEMESGRARVEVELTPRLRLETQTGMETDAGIGLRWRWDY